MLHKTVLLAISACSIALQNIQQVAALRRIRRLRVLVESAHVPLTERKEGFV